MFFIICDFLHPYYMNDTEMKNKFNELLKELDQLINLGDDIINFDINFN